MQPDTTVHRNEHHAWPARPTKAQPTLTTAQQLGSLIKSARDIMRKDKGLNGDLDRLPMLTWIMFLKFLDDMERLREEEAELGGDGLPPDHRAALPLARLGGRRPGHHRRRAARLRQPGRGACAPTARAGRACLPTCAACQSGNGRDRRDVIANVFRGRHQPHGQRLPAARRDQQGQRHPLHRLGGDPHARATSTSRCCARCATRPATRASSTPRGRWCVSWCRRVDPRLGETVLDPACGTGGFLRRVLRASQAAGRHRGEAAHSAGAVDLRPGGQAAALPAGADEPAAARAGVSATSCWATRWPSS